MLNQECIGEHWIMLTSNYASSASGRILSFDLSRRNRILKLQTEQLNYVSLLRSSGDISRIDTYLNELFKPKSNIFT